MTKTGNVYLRQAFLTAAQSLVNHNEEYQAYYQRKFQETPRHAHKRALSLTARKLVRLIYAMLTKNQLYMTPAERAKQNQEVKQENQTADSVVKNDIADEVEDVKPFKSNKKMKRTVAATSSSRQKELNGLDHPSEQYAVNT